MATSVVWDDSSWQKGSKIAEQRVVVASRVALNKISDELLRLSQLEVPFDSGHLLGTGNKRMISLDEHEVGYHTPYAAKMHEHPEYNFRNGRKGKYLEDPLKKNISVFRGYLEDEVGKVTA